MTMNAMIEDAVLPPKHQMKLLYPERPWETEPDFAEWFDAMTGYKCAIRRHDTLGHLNGYVGVFDGHPLHGVSYDNVFTINEAHGGLTYSKTDKDFVHWFGFDCGHAGDFSPGLVERMLKYAPESDTKSRWMRGATGVLGNETYRTWEYVEGEIHKLVNVLWKVEKP